jgi:hypothetical protein
MRIVYQIARHLSESDQSVSSPAHHPVAPASVLLPQANIIGWQSSAKISGCKRSIKLPRSDAQEAYNQLQAMLQQRAANKAHK